MSKSWKWNVKVIVLILTNFVIGFNFMLRMNETDSISIRHLLTSSLICSYILVFIVNEIETNKVYFVIDTKLIDCYSSLNENLWKRLRRLLTLALISFAP